jgi:hypothetical protein
MAEEREVHLFLIRHEQTGEYVAVIRIGGVETTRKGAHAMHYADEGVATMQAQALSLNPHRALYRVVVAQMSGLV